jgi:hypothetical protein
MKAPAFFVLLLATLFYAKITNGEEAPLRFDNRQVCILET